MTNPLSKAAQITLFFMVPFLMGTAIDLYVPSLPAIDSYFNSYQQVAQLTISMYMLGYSVGQLFLGIISDTIGRKKILLYGALLFSLFSFLAAKSPNIHLLIFYRFLQGITIAGMGVMCRIIAIDCFQELNLMKKFSYYSLSWSIGPIIAPLIGSYLQHYLGWQANFYFFTLFGLVISYFCIFSLPETLPQKRIFNLKLIVKDMKAILGHGQFIFCALIATLIYSCLLIFNVVGPYIVQKTLQYSVVAYGHIALLLGVGILIGIIINRLCINYFNPMRIFAFGLVCTIIILMISLIFSYAKPINIYFVVVPVFFVLFFCGLILSYMVVKVMNIFPHLAGTSSAIYGTISAGGIFIITSLATLLSTRSQIPMLYFYFSLFVISAILFFFTNQRGKAG